MNVTVIGNVNLDIVTTPEGRTRRGYGGILYNTLTLQALLPSPSSITPVAPLGEADLREITHLLDSAAAVSLNGFYDHPPGVNRCYLDYRSPDLRLERLETKTDPIPFHRVEPFLACDMTIVNFISGFDISLETMGRIAAASTGLMVMDVQSMSLSLEEGVRKVRSIDRLLDWTASADIVHLSREDLQGHFGEDIADISGAALELAGKIMSAGSTRVVLVSLGTDGSYVHSRGRGSIDQCRIPAYPATVVDTTGCGDAYTTAFALRYARTGEPEDAGNYASRVAARAAELIGPAALMTITAEFGPGSAEEKRT
jgi:sugar/nucleoside kinase (ribokinase family)